MYPPSTPIPSAPVAMPMEYLIIGLVKSSDNTVVAVTEKKEPMQYLPHQIELKLGVNPIGKPSYKMFDTNLSGADLADPANIGFFNQLAPINKKFAIKLVGGNIIVEES